MNVQNIPTELTNEEKALRFDKIKEVLSNKKWCGCHPSDIYMYCDICQIEEIIEKGVKGE